MFPAPARPLQCLHRLQKGLLHGLACSLVAIIKKYNISADLIRVIKHLYDKATSAALFNGSIGYWFRTTVGVQQGCLLPPTLFSKSLERTITDALEDHVGTVSKGGRTITNLHFADDTDDLAGQEKTDKFS